MDSSLRNTVSKQGFTGTRMPPEEARRIKLAKVAAREAQTIHLAEGVKVYPDCPPGVGWVLEMKGNPDRYWATRELAIARYHELTKLSECLKRSA